MFHIIIHSFQGRKLLVICTSKRRGVLEELGLLSMFTAVLRVPYIKSHEDVRMVLEESQAMAPVEVMFCG